MNQHIYKITNLINNKSYIGKAKNYDRRICDHFMEAHRQKTHTKVLYLAILKYGDSNFIHELIETCDESIINDREKFWIKYFNSNDRTTGYNRTIGGDGGDTYSGLTDEQKMICDNKKSEHGKRLIKDPVYMEKLRTATKELWKNEQYRNKVQKLFN